MQRLQISPAVPVSQGHRKHLVGSFCVSYGHPINVYCQALRHANAPTPSGMLAKSNSQRFDASFEFVEFRVQAVLTRTALVSVTPR